MYKVRPILIAFIIAGVVAVFNNASKGDDASLGRVIQKYFFLQKANVDALDESYDLITDGMRAGLSREEYVRRMYASYIPYEPHGIKVINIMGESGTAMVSALCTYKARYDVLSREELFFLVEENYLWKINEVQAGQWLVQRKLPLLP
ncbi:MAG: hypothetical protein NUW09_00140 [Deltaproteobacteria bacterium]|nr:hypothetical protein [Deltaproteobacteria bacterium]